MPKKIIRCIKFDGTELECEDADHPDYICTVHAIYIGPKENDPALFVSYNKDGTAAKPQLMSKALPT